MTRPDLLRTWVSDVPGVFDADYVWHDLAQQWQRPGEGEQVIAAIAAGAGGGAPPPDGRRHGSHHGGGDRAGDQ
jgi:hypothetical protein